MNGTVSRRAFVAGAAAMGAVSALPMDAMGSGMRFGYAAITWGDDVQGALDDISAVGYPGVQLRNNVLKMYAPAQLKEMLAQRRLRFVALSSGDLSLDKPEGPQIEEHVAHAQFLKDAGGRYLQILDVLKAYPRTATPDECVRLGRMLTELGKRTADMGVPLAYHNHLNTLSQMPQNLARILDASDARYVKLLLDVAHSAAGGGDPAKQIVEYRERLAFVHLKDYVDQPDNKHYPFQWVELGRGKVDLPAVFAALKKVNYSGWAVVELDAVPVKGRTPKQSAEINREYLVRAGYRV